MQLSNFWKEDSFYRSLKTFSSHFKLVPVDPERLEERVIGGLDLWLQAAAVKSLKYEPIRDQYSAHMTCIDQSEDSIQVT